MRATFILAVIAICLTLAHSQVPTVVSVYKFLGYNTNLHEGYNYECMTDKCLGPTPSNYTDETVDNVRSWFCGPTYANITVLMGWNVVWPGLYVYDGTGNPAVSCFSLGVEGDSSLSIYQGGLFFWGTTDFKVANCLLTSTANFEIRSLITFPFNPKTFDTMACPGSVVVKAYTGLEILELKTWSRRVAWRNLRGNITFPANGKTHTWNDYPLESVMELGNWPGFEPVFNIYGNFAKIGGWKTKTILSGSSSTIKMTWHAGSFVRIESPWQIADMKPTSGPNTMSGNVLVNNTNFQIEGRWEITPTANVYGVPGGFNNLTYVGTTAQNTLVLAGSFNSITFFANTTTGNYWTTGTFTNCNAYLTDRATSWTWNRRGAEGVATFNSVVLGVNNPNVVLTLRDGAFAFNSLTGPGTYALSNATLTVAGSTFTTSASLNSFSTLRLTTTASYTLAAPVLGSGTLQFVGGDHYLTSTSSASVSSLNVAEGASLTYPANALSVSVSSGLINRGTTYFGGRNTIANFTRSFSFTQTATGNTVIDFEYSLADGTGRFDALTFAGVMSLNGTLTLNAMATPVVQPDLSWFVPIRTTTLNGLVGGFSSLQHNVNSAVWTIAPCYLSDRVVITVVKTALSTAELWGASSVPLACRPVFVPVSPPVTPVAPPVAAPVDVPVAVPVTPPVAAPVNVPVAVPVNSPVAEPVAPPIAVPVAVPVTPPVAAPVDVPVAVPVTPPVAAPVEVPVAVPVTPPVAEPVAAPVDIPVTAPVTPVAAPVDVPVAVPVNPPVAEAVPVAAPVDVPEPVSVAEPVSEPVTVPVSAPIDIPVAVPVTPPVAEAVPVTPPVTEAVPVTPPVTEAVPVTPPVTEAVPVTPPVTEAVPVTPPVTEAVPVTPPVTEAVPVTPPVTEPVAAQETSSAPIADAPVESPLAVDAPVARR